MKTSRLIFLFTVINLIGAIVFIAYLPENVIFGLTGNLHASEYIGKWYNLIIPIAQVISTFIIFLVDIIHRDQVHKYRYLTAWVAVAFTTFLMWTLMFLQYENFEIGVSLNWPWTIMIFFPVALFLLAEGLYEYNKSMEDFSIFGMKWVRNSKIVWKKTHKVAGITSYLVSIILFSLAIINELVWHTYWIYLVAVLVWLFIYYLFTLLYAHCTAKNYGEI